MDQSALALHDQLLAMQPEGATHDSTVCAMCQLDEEGRSVSKTYSEEEAQALVAAAVTSATEGLTRRVSELEGAQATSEVEARIAEARAEGESKAAELQAALDAKEIELVAEKARADQFEADNVAAAEAAVREGRKAERCDKVREVSGLDDAWLAANADRLAAMSDELWAQTLTDFTALAAKFGVERTDDPSKVPATTALTAAREPETAPKTGSALVASVAGRRLEGIDVRRF